MTVEAAGITANQGSGLMVAGSNTLLPELRRIPVEPVDPSEMMMDIGCCWELFVDVRQKQGYDHGYPDGFPVANALKRDPDLSYDDIGKLWIKAKESGTDAVEFFNRQFDMTDTKVPVRKAFPGEPIQDYMDYMADVALRRPIPEDRGIYLKLPHDADVPGTRFIGSFPADNGVVALGKLARGNVAGALETIENDIYLIDRFRFPPNWNGLPSLDRTQEPTISFSIEGLATAYGDRGQEVIEHFKDSLDRYAQWWIEKRKVTLPGGDEAYHFSSDAIIDYGTMRGLRLESLYEDYLMAERVVGIMTGEERGDRFDKFMRSILAACESTKDFQPSTQSADYETLETIRTTEVVPISLQAKLAHLFRMCGRQDEANKLADVMNRLFWRDIDDTHGHYGDILQDGSQTPALDATMFYPLMVGGIVPYDRAIKSANTLKDYLLRQYGVLISTANIGEQWEGSPGTQEEPGENRGWPSVNMWVADAFTMAAIEAQMNGDDPEPLLEVAEMVRVGCCKGIEIRYEAQGVVTEKLSVVDPTRFVNGGEYGKTKEDEQKGFGMTIGAYRVLKVRDLRAEVYNPAVNSWRQHTLRHLGDLALAP
jgi:neutral trehalase